MKLVKLDNLSITDRLAGGEFLQSWFWGETLKRGGDVIARWGVEDQEKILASVTLVKKNLFGPYFYWYAPRGPRGEKGAIEFLLSSLKENKDGEVFFRVEPEEIFSDKKITDNLQMSLAIQPKKTLLLDLSLGVEELMKAMHQKTRYNIRLAEKKGIKIKTGISQDFPEFWRLLSLTGERDNFRLHDAAHYQNLLSASSNIKLFFAQIDGRNIAAGLFCFFGDRVTYLHGASDNAARDLMAPYLLQWEVIKQAQVSAYKYYDFYGIDEKKWPGVTRFKTGFGGFIKEYPGTYDYLARPLIYNLYKFLRKLRRYL